MTSIVNFICSMVVYCVVNNEIINKKCVIIVFLRNTGYLKKLFYVVTLECITYRNNMCR